MEREEGKRGKGVGKNRRINKLTPEIVDEKEEKENGGLTYKDAGFYFILFYFISFYFILFHFISFYFILFHFISFYFILFYLFYLFIYFYFYFRSRCHQRKYVCGYYQALC